MSVRVAVSRLVRRLVSMGVAVSLILAAHFLFGDVGVLAFGLVCFVGLFVWEVVS